MKATARQKHAATCGTAHHTLELGNGIDNGELLRTSTTYVLYLRASHDGAPTNFPLEMYLQTSDYVRATYAYLEKSRVQAEVEQSCSPGLVFFRLVLHPQARH